MSSLFSSKSALAPRLSLRQTSSRRHNIGLRVREIFVRPFALHSRTSLTLGDSIPPHPQSQVQVNADGSMTEKILSVVQNAHKSIRRGPPENTFFPRALRSDNDDPISLPFRLSIQHVHEKTKRGLPFLRQSWTRIDFVAIVSFWIMFTLAVTGAERGRYHIGLFRAMSVLRTTRLLAVTSGTTVSDFAQSIARLIYGLVDDNAFAQDGQTTSNQCSLFRTFCHGFIFVSYSFCMPRLELISPRIIGVQTFKGSLRRSCVLSAINGEPEIQLQGSFCGGYIDPITLQQVGYLDLNRNHQNAAKGYICPLGQICMVRYILRISACDWTYLYLGRRKS